MSFSLSVKQEILDNKPMRLRYRTAQAYGLLLFGHAFSPQEISLRTETREIVQLFQWFVRDLLGKNTPFSEGERSRNGKTVYTVALTQATDRFRLLERFPPPGQGVNREPLATPEEFGAFLAGTYLACGNVTDPEKSYHLEFVMRDKRLCIELAELLDGAIPGARVSYRRGLHIVYYKECAAIEDLLTLMGAPKSCLAMIDVETFKSVRNRANRATNCETANIDKMVGAATAQTEDIRLLLRVKGEDGLPLPLLHVAKLRLDNPEASLRELAELSSEPISRSGVHHRLDKLSRLAAEIREQTGERGDGNG